MRKYHVLKVGHDEESLVVHGIDEMITRDAEIYR
jgi:hypothetical protein